MSSIKLIKNNKLDTSNDLYLSSIYDQDFDKGLITQTDDVKVVLSGGIKSQKEDFLEVTIITFEDVKNYKDIS